MNERRRWLFVAIAAVFLTGVAAGTPRVLRRFESFAVANVEIRGTRYLAAYDALIQSGITKRSSVFDEFEPWRQKLLQHPMIIDARIERHLPGTIRVSITEAEPVALARTPELTPVDARGQALPIDPSSVDLDVPVLSMQSRPNAKGLFADRATRDVVSVLAMVRRHDQHLFSWVSEAGTMRDHGVRLGLRSPAGAEALVPSDAGALRLNEIKIALADLAARGELANLKRIDARFNDQIVIEIGSGSGPRSTFPDGAR